MRLAAGHHSFRASRRKQPPELKPTGIKMISYPQLPCVSLETVSREDAAVLSSCRDFICTLTRTNLQAERATHEAAMPWTRCGTVSEPLSCWPKGAVFELAGINVQTFDVECKLGDASSTMTLARVGGALVWGTVLHYCVPVHRGIF